MLVMKFGGTSVGNGERILNVARIAIANKGEEPIIVTSAMSGVTDQLLAIARLALAGSGEDCSERVHRLQEQHRQAAQAIQSGGAWDELESMLAQFAGEVQAIIPHDTGHEKQHLDAIGSWGERLAVLLVAGAVNTVGYTAYAVNEPLIVTDAHFGEATPLLRETRAVVQREVAKAREQQAIMVAPGFIGITRDDHRITTLGRGGSDYSATLLAAACDAEKCWIYTDVNGVYTADPRLVKNAQILPVVSYATAGRLSVCGAKVLHQRSVSPAARKGIELRVRNTFQPEHEGTLIRAPMQALRGLPQAVAGRKKLAAIAFAGEGLAEIPNLFGRMIAAVTAGDVEIVLTSHPVPGHDPEIIVSMADLPIAIDYLERIFAQERTYGQIGDIVVTDHLALCTLVGDGMGRSIFELCGRSLATINVAPRSQSAARDAVTYIIAEEELDRVVAALHHDIIEPLLRDKRATARRSYGKGQSIAGGKSARLRQSAGAEH